MCVSIICLGVEATNVLWDVIYDILLYVSGRNTQYFCYNLITNKVMFDYNQTVALQCVKIWIKLDDRSITWYLLQNAK